MTLQVVARTAECLQDYAAVSIAFEVTEVIDLVALQPGVRSALKTRRVAAPYIKDYDGIADNHPTQWRGRHRVDDWKIFTAHDSGRQIGGAIVVSDTELVMDPMAMLLWDLRVEPTARRRGVGAMLLAAAEAAVRSQGVRILRAETQDVNVGACRFYARRGFLLESIARGVYPRLTNESRLVWSKRL